MIEPAITINVPWGSVKIEEMNSVVLGLAGCGKGTQARIIGAELNLPVLAMGDVLRRNIDEQTEVGKRVKPFVTRGIPLPVPLMASVIATFLTAHGSAGGFIGDGIVRTLGQARALGRVLYERQTKLHAAIVLTVPVERLVARLQGRRVCPQCGAVYNLNFYPPKVEDQCDCDGTKLRSRTDDTAALIASRLRLQERHLNSVIEFYDRSGVLISVDGAGSREEVAARVREAILRNPH